MRKFLILLLALGISYAYAQTGPGGVGAATGSTGQPTNAVWLDGTQLSLTNDDPVTSWADKSGNGNNFVQFGAYGTPIFRNDGLSGAKYNVVRFDGTEKYLSLADNSTISGLSSISMIVVYMPNTLSGAQGIIHKRNSYSNGEEYGLFTYTSNQVNFDIRTSGGNNRINSNPTGVSSGADYVISANYDGATQAIYMQSVLTGSASKTGTISDATSSLLMGALNEGYGTYLSGDVAEVIVYGESLNAAQRLIVENYLSEKYGITITNDYYSGYAGGYFNEVIGIGNEAGATHGEAEASGFGLMTYDGSFSTGEYLFAGHNEKTATIVTDSLSGNAVMDERWSKCWYVKKTGAVNASLSFDFGEVIGGQYPQETTDYRLIRRNGSDYEEVTTASVYVSDQKLVFNVEDANLTDGYYSIATTNTSTAPLLGAPQRVWYSFKNGNWEDPLSWTLDGAVAPQYVNTSSAIPAGSDRVVITSGKVIQMKDVAGTSDYNNVAISSLELIGELNLSTSYGHNFGVLSGTGTLFVEGASTDDALNLPGGDISEFISTSGGTVEINGDGLTINSTTTFNDLVFNLDSSTDQVIQTADMTVNGTVTINQGVWSINDNSNTTSITIDLLDDLYVASAGSIVTGSANARHELNFYGDFTNDGQVAFTQRTSQTTGSEATDGIVDANFINDSEDQSIQCNNTTNFYRIEIDKGIDDTYTLNIDADGTGQFNLYGYANQSHSAVAQLTTNSNALGLIKGTVRIGENVVISNIGTNGNYNVSEKAKLLVDGGEVYMTSGNALVPYGGIVVSDGYLEVALTSGITTRGNGYLEVSGGRVKMNQFRTSIYGSENQGGFLLSGGIVYVTAGSTNTSYYAFSLTYEENAFAMTGGKLFVNANSRGGVFINSDPGRHNITAGELVCELDNSSNFVITSKAPFYDVTIRKTTSNSSKAILNGGTSANGTSEPRTLAAQPLIVYNDFTVENASELYDNFDGVNVATGFNASFDANGVDMDIEGHLTEQTGATFITGSNTVTFSGAGSSNLSFDNASTQQFNNLTVNKNFYFQSATLIAANATEAIEIAGDLNVSTGKLKYGSFTVSSVGDVLLEDTVGVSTSTGKLLLNGTTSQTITASTGGAIYNLDVDNSNGVSLGDDLNVIGDFTLTNGIFDINTHQLRLVDAVGGSGFDATKMIQSSGNASDGGLRLYVDGASSTESLLFPIGTNANASVRYTPAQLSLSAVDNDGYVSIVGVDKELTTVDQSALSSNLLTYYWRLKHSSFDDGTIPTVDALVLSADDSDDPDGGATPTGLPSDFVPGKVLDASPFTRSQQATTDISGLDITFGGFSLENCNYTAGDGTTTLFTGSPEIYYTTNTSIGNWNNESKWTKTSDGVDDGSTGYPGVGDVAVIKSYGNTNQNSWVYANIDVTVSEVIFDKSMGGWNPRFWVTKRNAALDLGPVSGTGTFYLEVTATEIPSFEGSTDLGSFSDDDASVFNFRIDTDNQTVNMPSNIAVYPNLRIEAGNGENDDNNRILQTSVPIVINGYVRMDRSSRWRINHDVVIGGDFRLSWQANRSTLELGDDREVTLEIKGDFTLENGDGSDGVRVVVKNDNQNSYEHTLKLGGDLTIESGIDGTSMFDLYNGVAPNNNAILEFSGSGQHEFVNNASATLIPDLYKIKMNKGSDTTSSFTLKNDFVLNGTVDDAEAEDKAMVLEAGLLVFDHADIDVVLADGGGDFEIPSGTGLEIKQGSAHINGDDVGVYLDGLLRVSGGEFDMDDAANNGNNYIEYSSSGEAFIDISSGSLNVGSQVRRGLNSTSGILKYRQTGGAATFGINAVPVTSRGVFEMVNTGSSFTHSAGDFTLVRAVNSSSVPSLLMEPETSAMTGSVITIGNSATPASSVFGIKASVALNDLTLVNAAGTNPKAKLYSRPLVMDGVLTVNSGTEFDASGLRLTLNSDFVNDGTYTPGSNTTYFSATSGTQTFSGSGTTAFYNLTKANAGNLVLAHDITVNNDLLVEEGTLTNGVNEIYLNGDATIQSSILTTSGEGIVFQGSAAQELSGLSNNEIEIGRITINNIHGVSIPDGNGYDFTITDALRLSSGILDVGGSLLTIGKDGEIEEVNTFGATNMVQTNSSFSDNGVKKIFKGDETSFVFPVGEAKYTPLVLSSITSIDEDGYLIVRPANELHPSVLDDTGTADDETLNALQYHWVVKSSGLTNATVGTAVFYYDQTDVSVTGAFTESDYIAARLTYGDYQWDKAYAGTTVNTTNNTMTFPLDESSVFAGEYTAGISNAFRDVSIYQTNGDTDFSSATNWQVSNDGGGSWGAATVVPAGARVIVNTGHEVTITDNNVRLLSTTINSGGRLVIDENYYGTRLGEVEGTGTLVLQNESFPTGNYDNFLICSGGSLEYASANSYQILSGISNVRAVTLVGSGTRTIASNNITICEDLVINGPTLVKGNSFNFIVEGDVDLDAGQLKFTTTTSKMRAKGDLNLTGGTFTGYNGADIFLEGDLNLTGATFTPSNADFYFEGSALQEVNGTFNLRNVTIDNSGDGVDFTTLGGVMTISGTLTLTDGLVTTSSTNMLTITSTGSYTGASVDSYINGPITKNSISSSYTFPVGKGGRYAPSSISNVTTTGQNWSSEYFTTVVSAVPTNGNYDTSDPGSGYNALNEVKANDRWNITSSGSNTAFIRLTYGAHDAYATTDDVRVTWWDASQSRWENQGGIVTGSTSTGTVISENAVHFSSQEFGLGSAPETPLPVTYTYFKAEAHDQTVALLWQTATEIDNDKFEIERSIDGKEFVKIGEVTGAGNSDELLDYVFTDHLPYSGRSYYRLKQIDYDGEFEYSAIVTVLFEKASIFDFEVYPNPVKAGQQLYVALNTTDIVTPVQVKITGINGNVVFDTQEFVSGQQTTFEIAWDQAPAKGLYILTIYQGDQLIAKRMMIF